MNAAPLSEGGIPDLIWGRVFPSAAPPQPKVDDATRGEVGATLSSVGSLQPAAVTAAVFATRAANIKQLLAKAA